LSVCYGKAAERGDTGFKEALLFARSHSANVPIQIEGDRFHIPGWDPDDPKHDAEFSNHPVARVRRVLDHVAESLGVAAELRELPGFSLPRYHPLQQTRAAILISGSS
jgi:hypothetical protein